MAGLRAEHSSEGCVVGERHSHRRAVSLLEKGPHLSEAYGYDSAPATIFCALLDISSIGSVEGIAD